MTEEIANKYSQQIIKKRITSIDILRGLVMLLMLVDHVRERFFYHQQVLDPMDLDATSPALFFTRTSAHFCAPIFIFLTGLSAWLYAHPHHQPARSPSGFLFKGGLLIILLEIAIINWLWMGNYHTLWLQVMWAIGISMLALSILCRLNYYTVLITGLIIVFGHNVLTPIQFSPQETGYMLWAILHDPGFIWHSEDFRIKVSYPVLPWIGLILLGYAFGPIYNRAFDGSKRRKLLLILCGFAWLTLIVLRSENIYGEPTLWQSQESPLQTIMAFINFTKYPPSLNFLLFTMGGAFLALFFFEEIDNRFTRTIETFGTAPLLFYILHLVVLLFGYNWILHFVGPNTGNLFAVDFIWQIWLLSALLAIVLYFPTKAFADLKHRSQHVVLKYL